jgi:hypothetical protein
MLSILWLIFVQFILNMVSFLGSVLFGCFGFACFSSFFHACKLKRERVEVCLNCKHFVECNCTGRFDECAGFVEMKGKLG